MIWRTIVSKGVIHTSLDQHPFSKIPPFLETKDVPTYYRPVGRTKVLNDSFNLYIISTRKVSYFWKNIHKNMKFKPDIIPLNVF